MKIGFFDFTREISAIGQDVQDAVNKVICSGRYILGKQLQGFEDKFACFCSVGRAVGVASGTDAIFLGLKALGVGPGDEVITTAHTFAATGLAILYTGAKPVFVDIEKDSYLIDVTLIEKAVTAKTKAIIPVHLYGLCADMDPIMDMAAFHGLSVLEDACQAHGAFYKDRPAGSIGHIGAFSFYPTKNLGAYGDAGAIVTNDSDLYERLTLLRNYGQVDKYHHEAAGYNSRLDEIQAAILSVKLDHLKDWVKKRQEIASRYNEGLGELDLVRQKVQPGCTHAYHLYVLACHDRDGLQAFLKERGIDTLIHYPVPLHRQKAFFGMYVSGVLPDTELRAGQVLSLPMHPWLQDHEIDYVIDCIREFLA